MRISTGIQNDSIVRESDLVDFINHFSLHIRLLSIECGGGLMDCIGKAVKANGGRTIGVVPTLVERGGRTFSDLDIEIPCDNLSDRKDLMLAQSDIFVALPGGIGTLDEIFTIAAAHTIGYHHKMVILYNMKGFWNSTIALLDDMAEKRMIRGDWRDVIEVADNLEELAKLCKG